MKLLIGSVFKDASPEQVKWLNLQLKFINETTTDFHHIAFVNDLDIESFKPLTKVIAAPNDVKSSKGHVRGLKELIKYFKEVRGSYDYFLLIDSDAFPIRKNWQDILCNQMIKNNKEIAVVLRPENLETRLHASILFSNQKGLDYLEFDFCQVGDDLIGMPETDVGITTYQHDRRKLVWTLIRTNQFNVHPVSCGIYYDMFYHHAMSSKYRIDIRGYCDHYAKSPDPSFENELMSSPSQFINKLAGWSKGEYAQCQ